MASKKHIWIQLSNLQLLQIGSTTSSNGLMVRKAPIKVSTWYP